MNSPSMIGRRIPKLDAADKASGRATSAHDVRLPGVLPGRFLNAARARARVVAVALGRAARLRGVHALLTAADNPPTKFGYGKDNTPLKQIVRSFRDEVAAVAAVDSHPAAEAPN